MFVSQFNQAKDSYLSENEDNMIQINPLFDDIGYQNEMREDNNNKIQEAKKKTEKEEEEYIENNISQEEIEETGN